MRSTKFEGMRIEARLRKRVVGRVSSLSDFNLNGRTSENIHSSTLLLPSTSSTSRRGFRGPEKV